MMVFTHDAVLHVTMLPLDAVAAVPGQRPATGKMYGAALMKPYRGS